MAGQECYNYTVFLHDFANFPQKGGAAVEKTTVSGAECRLHDGPALGVRPSDVGKCVNGKKVNIPSYQVKAGDVIEVRESSRSSAKFAKLVGPEAPVVALPSWLNREAGTLKGVVTKLPERSDIDYEVAEHLIVELYSK